MKIRFYKRQEIDISKWNSFIQNSLQYRIYALSDWLDSFSPDWSALINDDYSVVMPLPWKRKFGVNYLAQPRFTQQLGFFSKKEIQNTTLLNFLNKAKSLYRFAEININQKSDGNQLTLLKNYILDLNREYLAIRSGFSKSLILNSLRPADKCNFIYKKDVDPTFAIHLYRTLYQTTLRLPDKAYLQLESVASKFSQMGQCFTRTVFNAKNEIEAISLFFKDEKRIYNLCSATTVSGRKSNANYFLYDQLIREFSNSNKILDFEGSNIPGIESFYKKFGTQLEPYYFMKWNLLKWPYRLIKK